MASKLAFSNNCCIREFTADGVPVGRCWRWLQDGKTCPLHGDVSEAQEKYIRTGKLTDDPRTGVKRGE